MERIKKHKKLVCFCILFVFLQIATDSKLGVGMFAAARQMFYPADGVEAATQPQLCEETENSRPIIYLTFDDGPSANTEKLLKILKKYNVKATFFVVNTDYIDQINKIAEDGHTIGIHTATHCFSKIYASENAYFEDLYKMQKIIYGYTGQLATLLRFPGGSSNTVSRAYNKGIMSRLIPAVLENGFLYFDWNVDSADACSAKTEDQVYRNVTQGIQGKRQAVVLQHDTYNYSVNAVERIILWGYKNGYTFLPLDQESPCCHHCVSN